MSLTDRKLFPFFNYFFGRCHRRNDVRLVQIWYPSIYLAQKGVKPLTPFMYVSQLFLVNERNDHKSTIHWSGVENYWSEDNDTTGVCSVSLECWCWRFGFRFYHQSPNNNFGWHIDSLQNALLTKWVMKMQKSTSLFFLWIMIMQVT